MQENILIGISGGSSSGKSTLCNTIQKDMIFNSGFSCVIISLDNFYVEITEEEKGSEINFDDPSRIKFEEIYNCLLRLIQNKSVEIPIYNFKTHSQNGTQIIQPAQIIMFEGIFAFNYQKILDLMNYKIFIHAESDVRLCRRILRDTSERGRTLDSVLYQYNKFVKPAMDEIVYPTMKYADLIVQGNYFNRISVNIISQYLQFKSTQIQDYKQNLKHQIVSIANLIEPKLDFLLQQKCVLSYQNKENIVYTKYFIFVNEEMKVRQLVQMHEFFNWDFTINMYKNICKQYIKFAMDIMLKIIVSHNYKQNQVQVLKLHTLLERDYDYFKEINIVLFDQFLQQDYVKIKNVLGSLNNKKCKFIIISIYCDFEMAFELYKNFDHLIIHHMILFVINNVDKFMQQIQKCLQDEEFQKINDEFYINKSISKRAIKFFNKFFSKK